MTHAATEPTRRKLPLHWKMLIGFTVGLATGLLVYLSKQYLPGVWTQIEPAVNLLTTYVTQPAATIFLRLIFMLVIPLLFSALVIGVSEMGDVRAFGSVGWRTLIYTVAMSALAVVLGLVEDDDIPFEVPVVVPRPVAVEADVPGEHPRSCDQHGVDDDLPEPMPVDGTPHAPVRPLFPPNEA